MGLQESNVTAVRNDGRDQAVVFLHGFSGARDDTWDRFPGLLGSGTPDWDIFAIGYATTFLPDVVGIWSADPDLPILAGMLRTQLGTPPFSKYKGLALVAHSMGGLVVQKALVDDPAIAARVRHVVLFGTPSGGLQKASWVHFWKRQLDNMAADSPFITGLRQDWKRLYGDKPPFDFLVVAGASDQFVPPTSSLNPFEPKCQRVVAGDHLSIVKPATADAPSVSLLVATLAAGTAPPPDAMSQLRLAAERSMPKATQIVAKIETDSGAGGMSVKEIVDAAMALDRAGQRAESIALLQRHQEKDTDIKGTLAGRFKRQWLDTDQREQADRALALYQEALDAAKTPDQIYYLAINVAFMKFVYAGDREAAKAMATLALKHAEPPGDDVWKTATVAEAYLYLDRIPDALKEYKRLLTLQAEPWRHQSASMQATRIAGKLGNRELAEQLEGLFTPASRQVNKIFVSYSHRDRPWLDRLQVMMTPYLRAAETELDLWDDSRLRAGDQWDAEIAKALKTAGVAVALVSADFLASSYVLKNELPQMVTAAKDGTLRLLWLYISAAGWEETALKDFQATHDTSTPLDGRPLPEQNQVLKAVAQQVKAAALGATDRFKTQPR